MHLFKQKGIVAILRKSKKLRQRSTCLEKIVYLVSAKNIVFAAQGASNSGYTATTPYKRLGGIAGGVSSGTPVFENNYFLETENVPACFKYQDAGTEKALDFMKTEDFFNEITAAGGNYRFNSNGTPLLPAPKYAVSFVVTPAVLANVVIKVDGQKVASPVDLEAGTYKVEVSADNCAVFTSDIEITADTATHMQTIAMTYLPADYTKVDAAIAKANALNKDNYMDFSGVEAAVNAVVRGKNITEQSEVDAMAKVIEEAINALVRKSSGGDDSDPTYAIEVGKDIRNGTVTANRRYAERGDTVTITVKPDDGFKLDDLTVTDKNGKELKLTDKGNGKYTFTMPAGKVDVKATFAKIIEKPAYSDVSAGAWYADAVAYVTEKGMMEGSAGKFMPLDKLTRSQMAQVLFNLEGKKSVNYALTFGDMNGTEWYAEAVRWAASEQIVNGYDNGNFGPNDPITREQLVTILYRYAQYKGLDTATTEENLTSFADAAQVSGYAVSAMNWAVGAGVINGTDSGLAPKATATRAEVAQILMNFDRKF